MLMGRGCANPRIPNAKFQIVGSQGPIGVRTHTNRPFFSGGPPRYGVAGESMDRALISTATIITSRDELRERLQKRRRYPSAVELGRAIRAAASDRLGAIEWTIGVIATALVALMLLWYAFATI